MGQKCIHGCEEEKEGKDEWNADCRGMISALTPETSITFSTAAVTDPNP